MRTPPPAPTCRPLPALGTDGWRAGAFFTPLFACLLQFSIKGATALSQAAVTGAGLSGVGCLLLRTHPLQPCSPLINFDIALLLVRAALGAAAAAATASISA